MTRPGTVTWLRALAERQPDWDLSEYHDPQEGFMASIEIAGGRATASFVAAGYSDPQYAITALARLVKRIREA